MALDSQNKRRAIMTMATHCQLGLIPTGTGNVGRIDLRDYQWLWPWFSYSGAKVYFGRGLPTMRKPVLFDFDWPQTILPVIEVNQNSTAEGEIKLKVENLEEISTLTAVIYLVTPPDSSDDNWVGTGSDLFTTTILDLTSKKLSDGTNIVAYRFDPSPIVGIANDQFYGIRIRVNESS